MADALPQHLEPSDLGTKQYWDELYRADFTTHESTPSHLGTAWFDDANAEEKIVSYLSSSELGLTRDTTSFLDIGTGNASLLFALRDAGWEGDMLGVDYSHESMKFAVMVESERRRAEAGVSVRLWEWDVMHEPPRHEMLEGFDVVLDKGTFDAISLSKDVDDEGRRISEGYPERVEPLVKPGGLFLITSCNWTESELITWFVGPARSLTVYGKIKYPTFSFGGQTGQSVSSVCFRKKA